MTNDIIEELKLKRCTKCGELKTLSEFYTHDGCVDGHVNKCKECVRLHHREWYKNNSEKALLCTKKCYEKRKEHYTNYQKEWYSKNKEHRIHLVDLWRKANAEKVCFYNKNSEHRRRMQINATPYEYHITKSQWAHIIKLQNNKCASCGIRFSKKNKPTMDHIMPLSKGGEHTSVNIQALCTSCNCSKGANIEYNKIQSWINGESTC